MTSQHLSLIVTNVRLKTGDPARPWATALGIRGAKLAVVGSAAEILKMASTETSVVDARGQVMELTPEMRIGAVMTVTTDADGGVSLHADNG